METNIQNRNITISTKISAHQKVLFNQEAKKHNISLSEWVSSTLDLSIDAYRGVKPLVQIKQLQEEDKIKSEKIRTLTISLDIVHACFESSKSRIVYYKKDISELKNTNQLLSIKMEEIIMKNSIQTKNLDNKRAPVNNNYNFISGLAFIISLVIAGSVKN